MYKSLFDEIDEKIIIIEVLISLWSFDLYNKPFETLPKIKYKMIIY